MAVATQTTTAEVPIDLSVYMTGKKQLIVMVGGDTVSIPISEKIAKQLCDLGLDQQG